MSCEMRQIKYVDAESGQKYNLIVIFKRAVYLLSKELVYPEKYCDQFNQHIKTAKKYYTRKTQFRYRWTKILFTITLNMGIRVNQIYRFQNYKKVTDKAELLEILTVSF